MSSISATSRTLAYLREKGYICQKVEYWNEYSKRRVDLFNIIDIVALDGKDIIGIQSTSGNFSARNRKILSTPEAKLWVESGGILMLISWRKVLAPNAKKKRIWKPRVKVYSLQDFQNTQN